MRFYKADSKNILIVDYRWYSENLEEVDEWCWQTFNYHPRSGMVLTFAQESDIVLFLLKWS